MHIKGSGNIKQERCKFNRINCSFYFYVALVFLLGVNFESVAQIQKPKTPQASTFTPINPTNSYSTQNTNIQPKQNQSIPTYQNDIRQQQEKRKLIQEIQNERTTYSKPTVKYDLPSYQYLSESKYYKTAFEEISNMNDSTFTILRANFLTENAYYENKGDYQHFDKFIEQIGDFIKAKMKELNYNQESNLDKNLILLQFFSDTLKLKSRDLEHLPFKYDFADYMAYDHWENMFVEKLLSTNKGQCHSMPLLYLILAEEIGAKAHLAMSPNHSYIKFQNNNGTWINVELTNGMLTTDAFILQSGYMKAEALQNKVYMQPLTEQQLKAQILVDLAKGYAIKFGYDSFVEQVLEKAIELYPNSMYAQTVMSDYKTIRFMYVAKQLNVPEEKIHLYPKAEKLLKEMREQYNIVDNLGYEEMPLSAYEKWLNSLNEESKKQQSKQILLKLNQTKN